MRPAELVLTRDAVRELDRRATEELHVPSLLLMENAGRACADAALELLADASGEVVVACGPGNNGGDGLVVARTLRNRGRAARVLLVAKPGALERASEDVRANLRMWRAQGGAVEAVEDERAAAALGARLRAAPLVVDALFGTGLARPLEGLFAAAADALAGCGRPVLAVDLPSGLDADTGEVLGAAVRADATVTLVARKPGLGLRRGPELAGRVRVAEIGIPRPLLDQAAAGFPR